MSRATLIRATVVVLAWIVLATFPQWSGFWESSRFAAGIIRQILIFAIFASSLNLLVGYAGLPSLGHAAFFGGGAYAAAIAAQRLGTDELAVSLGAAILGAGLLAIVVGFLAVRALGIFFLMLTLALAQMVFAIAFQATDLTGGSNGFSGVHRPVLFGVDFNAANDLYVLVCASFLLVGLLLWRITSSTYGRALVGGAGTLVGPIVGAALVLLIERVLPSALPAQTVLGIVFIVFVVFARQGIVGAVRRLARA